MRFVCEWCLEKISIVNVRAVRAEVHAHFSGCPRRSRTITDALVDGLADHIADLIVDGEEISIRQAGS